MKTDGCLQCSWNMKSAGLELGPIEHLILQMNMIPSSQKYVEVLHRSSKKTAFLLNSLQF